MKKSFFYLYILVLFSCSQLPIIKKGSALYNHFEGKAQISISSSDYQANFGAEIFFTTDDSFHIKVQGPFGMDVGEVFIIGHRYLYLNHMDHQMMSGETDDRILEQVFQIPLSPGLLGRLPLFHYYFEQKKLDSLIHPWTIQNFNFHKGYLSSINLTRGNENIYMEFSRFKRLGDIPVAGQIYVAQKDKNQFLKITFSKIKKSGKFIAPLPKIPLHYRQLTI